MSSPLSILVVCTGNICRSPMAERMLAREFDRLAERFGAPWRNGHGVRVSSAGTMAHVGAPMTPEMAALVESYGLPGSGHAARQLEDELIVGADLVVALSREHRRRIVSMHPRSARYTFALPELARVMSHLVETGPDAWDGLAPAEAEPHPVTTMPALIETLALRRGFVPPPDDPGVDDVLDPYLGGPEHYAESGQQIATAVLTIGRSLEALLDRSER